MRILIVEDDEKLCYLLQFQLEKENFDTDTCLNGYDAPYYMEQNSYDLILLDRMLPGTDGITLLKNFREKGYSTPVIILTALGELHDKVMGLDSGADDYLVKPFAFEELLARIRCIRRRPLGWDNSCVLQFSDLSYNPEENILSGPQGSCSLSKKEGGLMELFIHNPNQILPRNNILLRVWGPDSEIEDGNLDNYIYFVRRRLISVGSNVSLKTVRGLGYSLCTSDVKNKIQQ